MADRFMSRRQRTRRGSKTTRRVPKNEGRASLRRSQEPVFSTVLKRFLDLNQIRLTHTLDMLTRRQQLFLNVLPLLFHGNYPALPGFSSRDCPHGIEKFYPSPELLQDARDISRSFVFNPPESDRNDILAIYLMGSPGSISFSRESDFDIWLCHHGDLSPKALKLLHKKAQAITKWAKSINLDTTIFLVNPTAFKNGISTPLSLESSGTTQHLLLLEEFFRTAILVAGKAPLWWIIPPEEENNYATYVDALIQQKQMETGEFVDLGSVTNIPADEFSGATLWQIYKGIDSPYKSLLKLMLMEAYVSEFPDIELICYQIKKYIYTHEEIDFRQVDPYLLILEKITRYLSQQQGKERLMLARQCFYLKTHCRISVSDRNAKNAWRIDIMRDMVKQWQWSDSLINRLDYQNNWKFPDVLREQKKLVDALTYSYRKLSDFFRHHNHVNRTSQRDLYILGRKLYAAFERKAGKIEIVNRQHQEQLLEKNISLYQYLTPRNILAWKLYLGAISIQESTQLQPLNQSVHILKLICWLYFNAVIDEKTNIIIFDDQQQHVPDYEIIHILRDLAKIYPDHILPHPRIETLSKPSYVENSCLFVNVGIDPQSQSQVDLSQLTTNKTDPFKFGNSQLNLVLRIDMVYNTSWTEVMYNHFRDDSGILNCINQFLRWNRQGERRIVPTLVSSYSCTRGKLIARRVQQLIEEVITHFFDPEQPCHRFVFAMGSAFYLLWLEDNDPKYKKIKNYEYLIEELSRPHARFSPLYIEPMTTDDWVLPTIYQYNAENKVQFFYYNHSKTVDIYILDNFGALYHQILTIEKDNVHINHFILFLNAVINRLRFDLDNDVSHELKNDIELEIYKLSRQGDEQRVEKQSNNRFPLPDQFLSIQAIGNPQEDNNKEPYFSIFCDDKEFSVLDYGNQVYQELARYVVNNRPSGLRYPIYITDMDTSNDLGISHGLKTIHISQLLKYKKEIEDKLNQAIQAI